MNDEKTDAFRLFRVFYGERQLLGAETLYTKHTEAIIPILETLLIISMSSTNIQTSITYNYNYYPR